MPEIQTKNKLITLEELGVAYNNITPANIGAVAKSGDTMTGSLSLQNSKINVINTTKGNLEVNLYIASDGEAGLYSIGYWNGNSFVASPEWLIVRDTAGKVAIPNHYNKDEVDAKIAGAIKFVTKTATTNETGRVADLDIFNISDKLINAFAISPEGTAIRIASYSNHPYLLYFVNARTGDTLANTSVSYRYVYME